MSKKSGIKGTWILDIEVYPNLFLCSFKDYKEKKDYIFEISFRKDDRERLFKALNSFKGFLVTFNGLHYDEVVLSYFLKEYKTLKSIEWDEFCADLKDFSDSVIKEDFEKTKWYQWYKRPWKSIDLMCYWSKGLRVSKQISLKGLGIQLNHPEVQELPFELHHQFTNNKDIEKLIHYNVVNDLGITTKVFEALKEQIELRGYIKKTYGIECWSFDAPKIASEHLLEDYCQKTFPHNVWEGNPLKNKKYQEYKKIIKDRRYEAPSFKIGKFLPIVNFTTPFFQKIYEDFKNGDKSFHKELPYNVNDTSVMLSLSVGGIHTKNDNQYWESDDEWVLLDCDIALKSVA